MESWKHRRLGLKTKSWSPGGQNRACEGRGWEPRGEVATGRGPGAAATRRQKVRATEGGKGAIDKAGGGAERVQAAMDEAGVSTNAATEIGGMRVGKKERDRGGPKRMGGEP